MLRCSRVLNSSQSLDNRLSTGELNQQMDVNDVQVSYILSLGLFPLSLFSFYLFNSSCETI